MKKLIFLLLVLALSLLGTALVEAKEYTDLPKAQWSKPSTWGTPILTYGNNLIAYTRIYEGVNEKNLSRISSINVLTGKQNWVRTTGTAKNYYSKDGTTYLAIDERFTGNNNILTIIDPTGKTILNKAMPKFASGYNYYVLKNGDLAATEWDLSQYKTKIVIYSNKGKVKKSKVIEGEQIDINYDYFAVINKARTRITVYDLNTFHELFSYKLPSDRSHAYLVVDPDFKGPYFFAGVFKDGTILTAFEFKKSQDFLLKAFSPTGKEKWSERISYKDYEEKYGFDIDSDLYQIIRVIGNKLIVQKGNTLYTYDSNHKLLASKEFGDYSQKMGVFLYPKNQSPNPLQSKLSIVYSDDKHIIVGGITERNVLGDFDEFQPTITFKHASNIPVKCTNKYYILDADTLSVVDSLQWTDSYYSYNKYKTNKNVEEYWGSDDEAMSIFFTNLNDFYINRHGEKGSTITKYRLD
ncbi:hypothetical protein [Paenibacillus sp. URB8-2]|uniref:hypothetical protein n=1 Tax=Paenibacillus sp. URB8-2 TaxID=2741301 RepID=UPI001E2C2CDA|nr:hypothetical protein [Paenibacillus sp. URB8-2]